MTSSDPNHLIQLVRNLHGYTLDGLGARRAAELAAGVAAALAAVTAEPQFHEEPGSFAAVLSALAPEGE